MNTELAGTPGIAEADPVPGPGTQLLADQLGLDDPHTGLLRRHPSDDEQHLLARALLDTAGELDAAFSRAQQSGRTLHLLRTRTPREEGADSETVGEVRMEAAARDLELALQRCEVTDTALIRLVGIYLHTAAR